MHSSKKTFEVSEEFLRNLMENAKLDAKTKSQIEDALEPHKEEISELKRRAGVVYGKLVSDPFNTELLKEAHVITLKYQTLQNEGTLRPFSALADLITEEIFPYRMRRV